MRARFLSLPPVAAGSHFQPCRTDSRRRRLMPPPRLPLRLHHLTPESPPITDLSPLITVTQHRFTPPSPSDWFA